MSAVCAILALLANGALLQVQSLPWTPGKSLCFTADMNLDGRAEVCVLEENTLHIYGRRSSEPLCTVVLPEHTSAIDIADLDQDGTAELVAVCEDKILRFSLHDREAGAPVLMFTHDNQFAHAAGYPFPAVLVVNRGSGPLISLPGSEALEIRNPAGELMDSYPVGVNAPYQFSIGKPFSYWTNPNAQTGAPEDLEFRVSGLASFKPLLPDDAFPIEAGTPYSRLSVGRQQWEADGKDPESWPWFMVSDLPGTTIRALYHKPDARADSTTVRVRTLAVQGASSGDSGDVLGPPRHYPGTLIVKTDTSADFNGDGYTDLVLWKSPRPSLTADSLARAVSSRQWPVSITTHRFVPEKKRFEAKPGSQVLLDIPLPWYFDQSHATPLRGVLMRDFNGDGKTDFACLSADDTIYAWQADEDGLIETPAFHHQFPAPVDEILFETDLEGLGSTSVAVRCGDTLCILRPRAGAPAG